MKKEINFQNEKEGICDKPQIKRLFGTSSSLKGVKEKRVSIVKDNGEKVLQIKYSKNKVGPKEGGAQWKLRFNKSYNDFSVQYKVKFNKNFEFVKGGKLPGLVGGIMPVGGEKSIGGFSARIMWRKKGEISQYVYYEGKNKGKRFGEDFYWKINDKSVKFQKNKWHILKTRIKMNTPGKKDGIVQSWFDNKLVLKKKIMLRAKNSHFGIDAFNFTTFFGGNDKTWAPKKDEYVLFDNFIISDKNSQV